MISISADSRASLLEFWQYRQLIYYLTWRDLKVRYKQAVLGVLWTVLQPLIFALIIGEIIVQRINLEFGFEGVSPIVIVVLSFSIWTYFDSTFQGATSSVLQNQGLMKKVYFPRMIPIISAVLTRIVDFALSFLVFVVILLVTGSSFHFIGFLLTPVMILMIGALSFFSGLIFGPLNVRYRDVKFILPFVTRILFFATPIWYPFSVIPEQWQPYFLLNPLVSAIEFTRRGFFDPSSITADLFILPSITLLILVPAGLFLYKKQESKIVDYI